MSSTGESEASGPSDTQWTVVRGLRLVVRRGRSYGAACDGRPFARTARPSVNMGVCLTAPVAFSLRTPESSQPHDAVLRPKSTLELPPTSPDGRDAACHGDMQHAEPQPTSPA